MIKKKKKQKKKAWFLKSYFAQKQNRDRDLKFNFGKTAFLKTILTFKIYEPNKHISCNKMLIVDEVQKI